MPKGGTRPGAGRPPGIHTPHKETLKKEAAREAVRAVIMKHHERMLRAQIAHSIGIGHLYIRDKGGKFTRIESEAQADELLTKGTEGEDYWIFMKDPSVQAFTDLFNRAFDKPREQEQEIKITGELELVASKLLTARKRRALTDGNR